MQLQNPATIKFSLFILITAFLIPGISWQGLTQGQAVTPWERFAAYDAASKVTIDHSPLTSTLKNSVMPFGRSTSRKKTTGKKEFFKNSHIPKLLNGSPSRLEGNRLMIHAFSEQHTAFFKNYQEGLENISLQHPLKTLNHNEQLAYWLNLYNVIVISKVIEEYPISKLKIFRKEGQSFWRQKVTMVENFPLSLTDIEQILIRNWDSPLVIYGLFQGSIGGPSLSREAYTGENVWKLLDQNAAEFVNSNRGVIPRKDQLEVSLFYQWTKGAFENSDEVLLAHINAYAEPKFMGDISHLGSIKYKYYDWYVADLMEGRTHAGDSSREDNFFPEPGTIEWHLVQAGMWNDLRMLPPGARKLLIEAITTNEMPIKTPVITTLECAPGDPCGADEETDGQ
ncbi:MAG: DUF547 domain-containing protein [Proteobacteria bacterium]|nr:DUF547 domain-containing protein [Pseudomonadota bacterium]